MIWLAWFILGLESLMIAFILWMMWVRIAEASREPTDQISAVQHPPERPLAQPLEHPTQATDESSSFRRDEDLPALFTLEEVDERGYVSSRKLHMGCEAAVCRTAFGAKIVAGRRSLKEPQYAWDYASVRLAEKALVYAEFNTHPRDGIIGVDDFESGSYPPAEPQDYFCRWRYTADGRMERF
jgi:hypothetical protein